MCHGGGGQATLPHARLQGDSLAVRRDAALARRRIDLLRREDIAQIFDRRAEAASLPFSMRRA
jgi:hypothetical protein